MTVTGRVAPSTSRWSSSETAGALSSREFIMFGGRRHFRQMLTQSEEGISSNILADRVKMLLDQGMITKTDDPTHKQKAVYSLTEKSIALVPIFAQLGAWGRRYTPATERCAPASPVACGQS